MKYLVLIFALMMSATGFAKGNRIGIEIKKMSINGTLSPNLRNFVVIPNKSVVLSRFAGQRGFTNVVEVIAAPMKNNAISLKFTVSEEDNGIRRVIGAPQLLAFSGQEGEIEVVGDNGDKYVVAVVATLAN